MIFNVFCRYLVKRMTWHICVFSFPLVPPKIINFSNNLVVNEGSNITLMCLANGKPEPAISWKLLSQKGKRLQFMPLTCNVIYILSKLQMSSSCGPGSQLVTSECLNIESEQEKVLMTLELVFTQYNAFNSVVYREQASYLYLMSQ